MQRRQWRSYADPWLGRHHLSSSCCQQEEVFKSREATLKRKDLELQDSLIRFSKFLQDNDMKRVRAHKKAQDERKLCDEQKAEIEQVVRSFVLRLVLINAFAMPFALCVVKSPVLNQHPASVVCQLQRLQDVKEQKEKVHVGLQQYTK